MTFKPRFPVGSYVTLAFDIQTTIGKFTKGHHFKIESIGDGFNLVDESDRKVSGVKGEFLTAASRCFADDHSYPYGDW